MSDSQPMSLTLIRARCLRLLARREHSEKELITKLTWQGFTSEDLHSVINTLAHQGLQSNTRFAEQYALTRFNQGMGSVKVVYELHQRGIDHFDLSVILLENFGSEQALNKQVYHQKYPVKSELLTQEKLKRQRFLQQRGFNIKLIHTLFLNLEHAS